MVYLPSHKSKRVKMVIVPHISIYPDRLVTWNSFENYVPKERNTEGLKENNPNAAQSQKSSKRLRNAVAWLCHLSKEQYVNDGRLSKKFKFQVNFITLTLPSPQVAGYYLPCKKEIITENLPKMFPAANAHFGKLVFNYSDKWIKSELLNQFLTELRQKYKGVYYVWKAETQANGNIHFHVTMNKYIYLGDLRNIWNRILSKSNMINDYQRKFSKMSFEEYYQYRNRFRSVSEKVCLKAYEKGCSENWENPNSTDVHSVKNIHDIAAYLCKYFAKKNETIIDKKGKKHLERRNVEGFLWRLSEKISAFKCAQSIMGSVFESEFDFLKKIFSKKVFIHDWSEIIYTKITDVFHTIPNSIIVETFTKYVDLIKNGTPLGLPPPPVLVAKPVFSDLQIDWNSPELSESNQIELW